MPDLAMSSVILSSSGIWRLTLSIEECRISSKNLLKLVMLRKSHLLLMAALLRHFKGKAIVEIFSE